MTNTYKGFPFKHKVLSEDKFIRKFSKDVSKDELVWHRDAEDREIEVVAGSGWSFQKENCLPFELNSGDKLLIKKNEWHRILKGSSDLIIKVNIINKETK